MLMQMIAEVDRLGWSDHESISSKIQPLLKVSGDSGSLDYLHVSGYAGERNVSVAIYTIPPVAVAIGAALLALFG